MKRYAPILLALCLLSGCASPIVRYVVLSEKATVELTRCVDAPPPEHMPDETTDPSTVLDRLGVVGPQLRQCQRAAAEAIKQSNAAKLRSDE